VFESVRGYLTDAATDTGLVLMFDDVHWADAPSLRLLRHLSTGLGAARLLLLITYRDTETVGRDELTAFLAALAREEAVSRIRLTGLSQDEVAAQLAAVTGDAVAPEVAAAIGRRTRGNPFFVGELGRLLYSSPGSLPEAVRDAVRVRLHDLTPTCQEVLCAAAVLGADLDPAAVAAVSGREVTAVLAALDEAAAAGLVVSGAGWSFGHDLVRETAQLELPTAERLAVHARMGSYLRGHPLRGQANAAPAVIAHHLLESLPAGDAVEAALWAERAASAAMGQLAWEDAAVFYARAVRAWPGAGAGRPVPTAVRAGPGPAARVRPGGRVEHAAGGGGGGAFGRGPDADRRGRPGHGGVHRPGLGQPGQGAVRRGAGRAAWG
jgi:predicted ATPase